MSMKLNAPQISTMPIGLGNEIRAPAIIQSFCSIVEELVLNSLDAGSRIICVAIDFDQFSIEVKDDGSGIDLTKASSEKVGNFGEWHCSSKAINASQDTFGFRGEAVAAISALSDVSVTSKRKGFSTMRRGSSSPKFFPLEIDSPSGSVIVCNAVFGKLVVRQRQIRASKETALMKLFLQKMSLLNHDVSWELVARTGNAVRTVYSKRRSESVSASFRCLHGADVLNCMVEVNQSLRGFAMTGLLSPPLPQFCHWTKEYQYSYLGKRWMRGKDAVSVLLNRAYAAIFEAVGATRHNGPRSKHANPVGLQTTQYPIFVLQLQCGPEEYDLLSEPDKTVASYARERLLRQCLAALVLTMLNHYVPDFPTPQEFIERVFDTTIATGADNSASERLSEGDEESDSLYYYSNVASPGDSAGDPRSSPLGRNYRLAFLPSQSPPSSQNLVGSGVKRKHDGKASGASTNGGKSFCLDNKSHHGSTMDADADADGDGDGDSDGPVRKRGALGHEISSSSRSATLGRARRPVGQRALFLEYLPCTSETDDNGAEQQPSTTLKEGLISPEGPLHSAAPEARVRATTHDANVIEGGSTRQGEGEPLSPSILTRGNSSTASVSASASKRSGMLRSNPRMSVAATPHVQAARLTKAELMGSRAVGQVDRKYILLTTGKKSASEGTDTPGKWQGEEGALGGANDTALGHIVVADQHAVDERVRLEEMAAPYNTMQVPNSKCGSSSPSSLSRARGQVVEGKEVHVTVQLSERLAEVALFNKTVLEQWCFVFSLPPTWTEAASSSLLKAGGKNVACALSSVPSIMDVPLRGSDFTEFLETLSSERGLGSLPATLIRPPAVNRILASRACRSARKFGDKVSKEECGILLEKLACTNFPFQCAHGRVSVKPLLQLRVLAAQQRRLEPSKPLYETLFAATAGNTD